MQQFNAEVKEINPEQKEVTLDTNTLFKQKRFVDEVASIIPFIDPDSTRFTEWLWSIQNARGGNDIHLMAYHIPDNFNDSTETLMKPFVEHLNGSVYYSKNYARGMRVNHEKNYPELYMIVASSGGNSKSVFVLGEKEEATEIISFYEKNYKTPNTITIQNLQGIAPDGSFITREFTLKESDQDFAHDKFYPGIKELSVGIEKYISEFMKSKSNILVLWGCAGVGKSSYLRNILFQSGRKNIGLANNAQTLMHSGFINWLSSVGEDAIIAIEDADLLVQSRDLGNEQMSAILNFAEGVIKNNTKLVISTNLSNMRDIDSALIRKGRAFGVLGFPLLTPEQANIARQSIGRDPVDFEDVEELTLSEALNWIDKSDMVSHKKTSIGFTLS